MIEVKIRSSTKLKKRSVSFIRMEDQIRDLKLKILVRDCEVDRLKSILEEVATDSSKKKKSKSKKNGKSEKKSKSKKSKKTTSSEIPYEKRKSASTNDLL